MANRRFVRGRGRAPRRKTAWFNMVKEQVSTPTGANGLRTVVLFLPATDADAGTVVRIVGSILMVQAATTGIVLHTMYAGIYFATVGSVSSATMDPRFDSDRDSEDWMWTQERYCNQLNSDINTSVLPNINVDIKVKRIVNEANAITLGMSADVAFVSIVNLRGLLLLS